MPRAEALKIQLNQNKISIKEQINAKTNELNQLKLDSEKLNAEIGQLNTENRILQKLTIKLSTYLSSNNVTKRANNLVIEVIN